MKHLIMKVSIYTLIYCVVACVMMAWYSIFNGRPQAVDQFYGVHVVIILIAFISSLCAHEMSNG